MVKQTGFSCAGKSLLERLWEELDDIIDSLMTEGAPELTHAKVSDTIVAEWQDYGELRGRAQGVAYAIAIIQSPYQPSVPVVKNEAMLRWEAAQQEQARATKPA